MKGIGLRFNAGVEYQEKIYVSGVSINGLFELDLVTGNIRYIKRFSREESCFAIHRCAFLYGKEAWFIPQNGKYIAVVNLNTLEIVYLDPPYKRINTNAVSTINAVYYSGDIIGGRYLYLIPANIDALLVVDMKTKQMYPYYNVSTPDDYHLYGGYVNGCVYLFPFNGRKILEVNLLTGIKRKKTWKYEIHKYGEGIKYGDKYWFSPFYADHILALNLETGENESIPLNEYYDEENTFDQIANYNEKIFLLPYQADRILIFDIKTKSFSKIVLPEDILENGKNGFTRIYSEKYIIFASFSNNAMVLYDTESNSFQIIKISISLENLIKDIERELGKSFWRVGNFLQEICNYSEGFYSEDTLGLGNYIKLVPINQSRNKDSIEAEKNVGRSIWASL